MPSPETIYSARCNLKTAKPWRKLSDRCRMDCADYVAPGVRWYWQERGYRQHGYMSHYKGRKVKQGCRMGAMIVEVA